MYGTQKMYGRSHGMYGEPLVQLVEWFAASPSHHPGSARERVRLTRLNEPNDGVPKQIWILQVVDTDQRPCETLDGMTPNALAKKKGKLY